MEKDIKKTTQEAKQHKSIPTISAVLPEGDLLEMVYIPDRKQTAFAIWKDDRWSIETGTHTASNQRLIPYSPENNLIKNEVVLFPSEPQEYGSEEELLGHIQDFIHRYVDVSALYEKIASYYVLFTWLYDSFNELPYLRLRGDPGSGKTRFLLTVGSLCYKPIFASGASSVSPLFRIIDTFRGTLIVDEGDFRLSDERAEVVKILNNGNARGFPVLRSEVTPKREFNPTAYTVFGPKIIATRGLFEDRALESRCLTEITGQQRLRGDIPINLPASHKQEALELRNKLLLFRFRNVHKRVPTEALIDRSIEPRLNQVFAPLLSIIESRQSQEEIRELAKKYHQELVADRGLDAEAQLLEIIRDLIAAGEARLSVKDITNWFADRHGDEYERKISARWIGNIIRKRLLLKTQKSNGVYIIPTSETHKLSRLYEKYGISSEQSEQEHTEPIAEGQ